MLDLSKEDLQKLELKYKPFSCPRCGETHQEVMQWAACRIMAELKKR